MEGGADHLYYVHVVIRSGTDHVIVCMESGAVHCKMGCSL